MTGDVQCNRRYARAALLDCLGRGEAPFASHVIYAQPGVLDDQIPAQREQGIEAGLAWGAVADVTVVYTDLGISPGMRRGIARAEREGRPVEYRQLPAGAWRSSHSVPDHAGSDRQQVELIPYDTGGRCAPRPWFPISSRCGRPWRTACSKAVGVVDFDDDEGHTVVAITVARCRHHLEQFDVHVVPFVAESELSVVVHKQPIV